MLRSINYGLLKFGGNIYENTLDQGVARGACACNDTQLYRV
jgi:hypothetical protein